MKFIYTPGHSTQILTREDRIAYAGMVGTGAMQDVMIITKCQLRQGLLMTMMLEHRNS